MTIINSIYKGKRYAILLTTILTFYAPVLFAQHIADPYKKKIQKKKKIFMFYSI